MNDQQLIDRGVSAQELLSNITFQSLSKELLDHYIATFLATAPEDSNGRNSAYFQCRALQDLIAVLQQWVYVKDNIINKNSEEE